MTKTALEVATEALRQIKVVGMSENASPEDYSRTKAHLDDLFETLSTTHELALTWTVETVPNGAFLPLARMLAGSIAGAYGQTEFLGLYRVGLRDIRAFELGKMKTDNQPIPAVYF